MIAAVSKPLSCSKQHHHRFPALRRKPDALVISGGGVRGLVALGALAKLRKAHVLDKVDIIVGTSAGALVGALIATGGSIAHALRMVEKLEYDNDWDIVRLIEGYGLDSGTQLERLIRSIVGDLTFAQVRERHGVRLFVTCSNITKNKVVHFGPDEHGDMQVALALRMSCSIPIMFTAVHHQGDLYVDGGLHSNYSWKCALDKGAKHVLGLVCDTTKRKSPRKIPSLESYVTALLRCGVRTVIPTDDDKVSTLVLHAPIDTPLIPCKMNHATIATLYESGVGQANMFLKKIK